MKITCKVVCVGFLSLALFVVMLGTGFSATAAEGSEKSEVWYDIGEASDNQMQDNIAEEQTKKLSQAEISLVRDAITALEETRNAVQALDEKDEKKALASLEKVTGKLELLLARQPELGLMPISVSSETVALIADIQAVKGARAEVEYLVNKGYLQAARKLLDTLVSEIRITSVNLPLNTYPGAIKLAVRLVDKGDMEDAKAVLARALDTLVITERSIPIPILNAQFLVNNAFELVNVDEGGEKLSDENKDKVLDLLSHARTQLQLAEELGYGRRDREFAGLDREIANISEKIGEDKETSGLFEQLKGNLIKFYKRVSE